MVTTFVHSPGSQTQGVWKFLEKASQTDVELLCGKGLDLCSPSFYRALKMDVGGVSRDC